MPDKRININALYSYTPEQIADAIRSGQFSMYELSKTGNLTPLLRKRIQQALDAPPVVAPALVEEVAATVEAKVPKELPTFVPASVPLSVHKAEPTPVFVPEQKAPVKSAPAPMPEPAFMPIPEPIPAPAPQPKPISQEQHRPRMFQRPFSFKGRIRRLELWISGFIYIIALLLIFALLGLLIELADASENLILWVYFILIIPVWVFSFSQSARRCHDLGHSGWYQLIPFYVLWLAFQDSQEGPNEYGDYPKPKR